MAAVQQIAQCRQCMKRVVRESRQSKEAEKEISPLDQKSHEPLQEGKEVEKPLVCATDQSLQARLDKKRRSGGNVHRFASLSPSSPLFCSTSTFFSVSKTHLWKAETEEKRVSGNKIRCTECDDEETRRASDVEHM